MTRRLGKLGIGAAVLLLGVARPAQADEPVGAHEPHLMSETSEITSVADAFDGDDPFVSVSHIDRIIDHATRHDCDFVVFGGLPLGATGFGVSLRALEKVCRDKSETNTEVWGHMMTRDPALRCTELTEADPALQRPDVRMTLDYAEDYAFCRTVTDGLAALGLDTSFENVMLWLERHPEAVEINRGVAARYEQHIAKSRQAS